MDIITINMPESYLPLMDSIVGENKLYCSRSEFIRVAVRAKLLKIFANCPGPFPEFNLDYKFKIGLIPKDQCMIQEQIITPDPNPDPNRIEIREKDEHGHEKTLTFKIISKESKMAKELSHNFC
jgi:hypothetical protein